MKRDSKFKKGDKVIFQLEGKMCTGEVYIIDNLPKGYRYDIMCSKPRKILIKHIYEVDLQRNK